MKDLIETVTASDTPLAIWFDDQIQEIAVQYGYVVISLPVEDFYELAEAFAEARDQLEA